MQEDESYLNKRGLTHFWENIDALKQDKLTAGANITIASDNTISASQPTVNNATLTIQKEGTSVGTFTANASTNSTVNIVETDPTVPAWAKASSKPSYSWTEITNKPTIPTKTSDLTNDSGFLTNTDYATASTGGVVKVGGGLEITNGVLSATGGGTADAVEWANVLNKPTDVSYWTNDAGYITSSDLPTVGDATLTIQKNGTSAGTFTANATSNKTINITVPTTAADVSALPASTKYGASIAVSINTTDYKVTTTLKDQDGNTLGTAQVIDLPLESVVVNGSYDNTNKKIVLTLQSGSTIDIPVADLVAGLQSEITSTNKLASDLVDDTNQTHKFMTSAEKTKLSGIAAGAEVNVQSDWDQTTTTADDYIKNKPSIPTKTSDLTNDSNFVSDASYVHTDNNYTTTDKNKLAGIAAGAEVNVQANWTQTTTTADDYIKNKPTLATVATSGSYNDLSNKPTIPAAQVNSDWDAASGVAQILNKPTLATVATSGSYNDLSNKPTIPAAQVQSNWTQTTTTAVDYIKNKPTLATVATSGSYNDLSNKPTIPTVNNATLTIQKNGTNVQTFTANQSTNATANITVPTKTSELTNDSGFLDSVAWGDVTGKPTFAAVATSGSYNDLSNKPSIPTVDSSLSTSSTNAIQNKAVANALNDKVNVASVDLTGQTTTLLAQIKALGTAQKNYGRFYSKTDGGSANISDKPTGSTNASFVCVAYQSRNNGASDYTYQVLCWTQADTNPYKATVTTASTSISWTRQQPTVNNGTLTIQKNGTNVQTFTANSSSNKTANITVPTTVAELSDASSYATTTDLAAKQDTLTAGDHIDITGSTIKAEGYVHSENPQAAAAASSTITGSMMASGTITADKLAPGATVQLTLSSSDIGEGAPLAANTLYGVYL